MRDPKERIRSLSTPLRWLAILAALTVILILGIVLYRIPTINNRLAWRIDAGMTTLRTFFSPIGLMPTPVLAEPEVKVVTLTPTLTRQPELAPTTKSTATPKPATATPTPTDAPLPDKISLPEPAYERQDWNSCGPATLAMVLHFYGWEGSQEAINALIKPLRADRNVNIDELASFVNTQTAGLRAEYRVGGDLNTLHRLLAAGFPVIIEETFFLTESYWFNDDRWSGHYQLITGYDDSTQRFITQDSFVGPNRMMTYTELDSNWQAFNRAYLLVYPIEQEESIKNALKDDWDVDTNRQHALETAQAETESDPTNPYAWFNLGTNLVYFERYPQAASAYDTARQLELPQRMMRYQFGPFLAYFHGGRTDDLLGLAEYALKVTPNSEEALLWKGWALYRLGQTYDAIPLFQEALKARPNYSDAIYALEFMQGQ
jgi:hypothetical protein